MYTYDVNKTLKIKNLNTQNLKLIHTPNIWRARARVCAYTLCPTSSFASTFKWFTAKCLPAW